MIGAEFTGVLHAAQQGRVSAFERLWADLHPGLIRYLRVVAVADADDIACESWVDVVRRLTVFDGDEAAWRAQVFGAARMHAEDENQRRVWDAMAEDEHVAAVLAEPLPAGDEPFEADEVEGGPAQGLRLALEAVRDLPPEQGDVLMLRLVAELDEHDVAALVGSDVATVHALEQQGLDRLGLDAELLGWALAAEPRPVELADAATVVGFFRAMVPEQAAPLAAAGRTGADEPDAGPRVITLRRPTWRARAGAVGAVSAGVIGLGAISAAAYQGVFPDPVQNVMHVVIGAPEPTPVAVRKSVSPRPHKPKAASRTTAPAAGTPTPAATTPVTHVPNTGGAALCRVWATQQQRPVQQRSAAVLRSLAAAAGGSGQVRLYCAFNGVVLPLPPLATALTGPSSLAVTRPSSPTSTPPTTATTAGPTVQPPPTTQTPPQPTTSTANPSTAVPSPTTTVVPPTATTSSAAPSGSGSGQGTGVQEPTGDTVTGTTSGKGRGPATKPTARRATVTGKG